MELNILETTAVRVIQDKQERLIFPPALSEMIKERYQFIEYPKSIEDFTAGAGINYSYGYFDDFVIGKMIVYNDAVFVTAQTHSDKLDALADDFISQLEKAFDLNLDLSDAVSLYSSKVEVELKPGFSDWFSQLQPVIDKMSKAAKNNGILVSEYQMNGFSITGEGDGELKPGRFLLERRAQQPFAENLFFSEAPLSTDAHRELLEEIEGLF